MHNIEPHGLRQNDDPDDGKDIYAGLPWNHAARFDGIPGLVWYSTVRPVSGGELRVGDWLDSLDHRGARLICGIWIGETRTSDLADAMIDFACQPDPDSAVRTVMFSAGDTETVRCDVDYDVVDPNSQVTPDGSPVVTGWPEAPDPAA